MKNLIKCDFYKMYKEKAHIILFIVLVGLVIISYLMIFALKGLMSLEVVGPDIVQTAMLQASEFDIIFGDLIFITHTGIMGAGSLGIFIVLSISINLGNDYRNRTINLKVMSGHSRLKIFSASVIVNSITFFAYFILCGLASMACAYIFFGGFGVPIKDVINNALLMLPHYFAIIAITIFISTSLKSTLGIVINLLVLVALQFLGTVGMYLALKSNIILYITEIIPYTAMNILALGKTDFELAFVLRNVLGAIAFTAAGFAGSYVMFSKKELV